MRKTVIIKRRPNTTNLPDHVYDSAKKRIGATYNAQGDVNTGLSIKETNELMPHILGVSTQDPAFFKKVKEFFFDLSVDVPAIGVELEVGVDKDDSPYELMDYIKYKFAIKHPYLLVDPRDPAEVRKKRKYIFTLEDKSRERAEQVANKNKRKEATKEWIKLTADEKKMAMVLRVLGEFPDSMDQDTMEITLEKIANETPSQFLAVAKDKQLETKAFIRNCVSAEVLRKVGNSYMDGEEVLGHSEEEAVIYLQDKANSETLLNLKAKLKHYNSTK
ncbi:hypothetical protein PP178_03910 [Zeaxanthinibacter sp. PT1]|uniref:hypothetical protein n=1 Tax=Zeaxanthinibacter TaxID=561554 RepID=UPI002349F0E8|nr:hypothetical protein [Zeaxanthinibacter sp. PT1]MDC6350685.1 hypothetical protein [Zeaxanthinibacter sp. PT1]